MDLKDNTIQSIIKQNIINQFTVVGFNSSYYYPRESELRLSQKSWLAWTPSAIRNSTVRWRNRSSISARRETWEI